LIALTICPSVDVLRENWRHNPNKCIDILIDHNLSEVTPHSPPSRSSPPQINQIAAAYEARYNSSLEKAITDAFSGELETAVLSLIFDPIDFFARRLKVSLPSSPLLGLSTAFVGSHEGHGNR
jgi:hypothetical protein